VVAGDRLLDEAERQGVAIDDEHGRPGPDRGHVGEVGGEAMGEAVHGSESLEARGEAAWLPGIRPFTISSQTPFGGKRPPRTGDASVTVQGCESTASTRAVATPGRRRWVTANAFPRTICASGRTAPSTRRGRRSAWPSQPGSMPAW